MKEYVFDARTKEGQKLASTIYATSRNEALVILKQKGLFILLLKEKKTYDWKSSRISLDEVWIFNQKLIALTRGGLSLSESLEQILKTTKNKKAYLIIEECIRRLNEGNAFHQVAKTFPEFFDELFIAALMTADKTGNLLNALLHYQVFLVTKIKTRKKVINALIYPAFLLSTLIIIISLLFIFVLPKFAKLYADMQAELPLATRVLIGIVDHLFVYSLVFTIGCYAIVKIIKKANISIPVLSRVIVTMNAAYISRSLSAMLLAGATVTEALQVTVAASSDQKLTGKVREILADIEQGKSLAQAFEKSSIFPDLGSELIAVGEGGGQLPDILVEISTFYETQLDSQLSGITALIEPVLMLVIGLLVGGIIITMYLPIFSMAEVIK